MRKYGGYTISGNNRVYCMFVIKDDNDNRVIDINSLYFERQQNYFKRCHNGEL
jgi:hypothetical protein